MSENAVPFQPFSDWLLVYPMAPTETSGGIALPDNAEMGPPRARVVKAGPGWVDNAGNFHPTRAKVGDIVRVHVYGPSFAVRIDFDGVQYALVKDRDILGLEGADVAEEDEPAEQLDLSSPRGY